MKRVLGATVKLQNLCLFGAAAFLVVLHAGWAEAGLLVSEVSLVNQVFISSDEGNFNELSAFGGNSPVPVSGTLDNAVGGSNSHVNYALDWSGDTGNFRVDGAHTAIHPTASLVQTTSNGYVNFTPMVDSLITLRVQYTYDLPGNYMEGFDTGEVFNLDTKELYAQISHGGFSLGPVSGSFDQTITAVIPANCNCEFVGQIRLTTHATSVAATDSGIVELSIVPLPEPAIFPLVLALMALRRRTKYHAAIRVETK